jgi:hypothetical protein
MTWENIPMLNSSDGKTGKELSFLTYTGSGERLCMSMNKKLNEGWTEELEDRSGTPSHSCRLGGNIPTQSTAQRSFPGQELPFWAGCFRAVNSDSQFAPTVNFGYWGVDDVDTL